MLPYIAGRALDPRPFGCEIVIAADAAADVVFVVLGLESVVWGWFRGLDADLFCLFAIEFGHGLRIDGSSDVSRKFSKRQSVCPRLATKVLVLVKGGVILPRLHYSDWCSDYRGHAALNT